MRNLKKILALVLALVMSLSLMATAGAASFPDVADDNVYKTAIDVLNGVEVLQGYDNGARFEPKGAITRAEAAAVIYRIATGDVADTQKDIYTAWNGAGKLSDVSGWYAGYVNYCCNAGYIKGYPNGTFQAQNNVTGYEVLAMVLRAMGYGRNNEFSGSQWAITTASLAQTLGITKNVKENLGDPATREMVAEIVFRAIFCETQMYNALHLYEGTGTNLAANLNLEEVEGVVIANEYADLYDNDTLADGKTMVREGDKDYTINYGTTLDDLGESRMIYIQNKNTVISLADSGKNVKEETTAKEKLSDVLGRAGISQGDAEPYLNFGQGTNWHSDWRIRYELTIETNILKATAPADRNYNRAIVAAEDAYGYILPDYNTDDYDVRDYKDGGVDKIALVYSVSFRIDQTIGAAHQNNIEEIFNRADRKPVDKDTSVYVDGEVYAGTTSMEDVSDDLSLKQFIEKYIIENDTANVNANERGNWLKVIDNNGDGVADYIFKVMYTFAQVTRIRDDKITLDVKDDNLLDEDGDPCVDVLNELTGEAIVSADELVEDDVVYYAIIDGKAQTYKAAMETATIDKINRNARTATSSDGTEWTESEVCEHIKDENYNSSVGNLVGKVKYDLFFDRGGYLAAFIRSDISNNFRLILDGWYNEMKSGTEYAVKYYDEETGKTSDPVDITTNGGLFIDGEVDDVQNNDWSALKYFGNAVENGVAPKADSLDNDPVATLNGANGADNVTKTTVASISEDGTILPVHSQYVTGRNWHDMIDMKKNAIPTEKSNSTFGVVYDTTNSSDTAYDVVGRDSSNNPMTNVEVIARADTVYYVVYNKTVVETATGYKNAPTGLDVEDVYVVGTFRGADNDLARDYYYTADMVVIEVSSYENDYEAVFVLDDETSENDVSRRYLRIIGEDGKERNVYVWNGNYRLATSSYADTDANGNVVDSRNGWKILPGVYKLYDRSTDLYTLKPMTAEELRDNNFIAGYSQYVGGVAPEDFVVMRTRGLDAAGNPVWGEDSIPLAEGSLYNVWYNTDHANTNDKTSYHRIAPTVETSTDYRDVLAGGVEEIRTTENDRHGNVNREFRGSANSTFSGVEEGWSYFYNKLLVKTNAKGEMVYAISFGNVYGGHGDEDYDLAAWTVWESNIPAAAKAAEKAKDIVFNLKLGADDGLNFYDATGKKLLNEYDRPYVYGDKTATIPGDVDGNVTILIEGVEDTNVAAVVPSVGGDWVKINEGVDTDTGYYKVVLADKTGKGVAASLARTLAADDTDTVGTVYTAQAVTNLINEAAQIDTNGIHTQAQLDRANELLEELGTIQTHAAEEYDTTDLDAKATALQSEITNDTKTVTITAGAHVKAPASVFAATSGNTSFDVQVEKGYKPTAAGANSGDFTVPTDPKSSQDGAEEGYVIWTITSKAPVGANKSITINASATDAVITLDKDGDSNIAVAGDAANVTARAGAAEIKVYVKTGLDLKVVFPADAGTVKVTKGADKTGEDEHAGSTEWTLNFSEVYAPATAKLVAASATLPVQLVVATSDAKVTAVPTDPVPVVDKDKGTAEVEVTVTNGYRPVAAGATIVFTTKTVGENTTVWKGAVSNVFKSATATITTAPHYVTLTKGDNVTIADTKAMVATSGENNGKAVGTVVVAKDCKLTPVDKVEFKAGETDEGGKTTYTVIIADPDPTKTYTITATAIEKGAVTFKGDNATVTVDDKEVKSVEVEVGTDVTFTVEPATNYEIKKVMAGDQELTANKGVYTVENVQKAGVTVTITAEVKKASVTFTAKTGATYNDAKDQEITSPLTDQAVGSKVTFKVVAGENYRIASVKDGGKAITADKDGIYSVTVVEAGNTITVEVVETVKVTFNATGFEVKIGGEGEAVTEYVADKGVAFTFSVTKTGGGDVTGVTPENESALDANAGTGLYSYTPSAAITITIA